jgi:hypothetical protein
MKRWYTPHWYLSDLSYHLYLGNRLSYPILRYPPIHKLNHKNHMVCYYTLASGLLVFIKYRHFQGGSRPFPGSRLGGSGRGGADRVGGGVSGQARLRASCGGLQNTPARGSNQKLGNRQAMSQKVKCFGHPAIATNGKNAQRAAVPLRRSERVNPAVFVTCINPGDPDSGF